MEYNRSRRSSTQNAYFGMSEEQRNRDMDILRFKLGHMKASIDNTPPRTYVAPPPAVRDRMDPREQRRRSLSPAGGERRSNQDSGVPYFSNTGGDVTRRAPSKVSVVSRSSKYGLKKSEATLYTNFVRLLTSLDSTSSLSILNDALLDAQESQLLASYTGIDSGAKP